MSDDEKESSGLGFLLALGGAAAAIYTAYKVFIKPDTEQIGINNIANSVESEVSILIPAHFEEAGSTIREAKEQHHLTNFDVLALDGLAFDVATPLFSFVGIGQKVSVFDVSVNGFTDESGQGF